MISIPQATITNLDRIIADLEGALRTCTWQLQEVGKLIDSARGEAGIDSQLIDLVCHRQAPPPITIVD